MERDESVSGAFEHWAMQRLMMALHSGVRVGTPRVQPVNPLAIAASEAKRASNFHALDRHIREGNLVRVQSIWGSSEVNHGVEGRLGIVVRVE